jgi:hypothetical protein
MIDLICSTIIVPFFHAINSSQIVVSQRWGKKELRLRFFTHGLIIKTEVRRRWCTHKLRVQQHELRWHATFVKQRAITCDVNSVGYLCRYTVLTKNKTVNMQRIKYFTELIFLYHLYTHIMDCAYTYNTSVYKLPVTKTCPHFMLAKNRCNKHAW